MNKPPPETVPAHAEVDADGRVVIGDGPRRYGLHNLLWRERNSFWPSTSAQVQYTVPPAPAAPDALPPAACAGESLPPPLQPLPPMVQSWQWPPAPPARVPWWLLLVWAVVATLAALFGG